MPESRTRPVVPKKGSQVKKAKTYLLEIEPGTAFRLKRVDLLDLFLEGALPMPLFSAIGRIQATRQKLATDDLLGTLTPEDRAAMMEALRRVAVAVVVDPKMTHSKKEARAKDLVWVGGITDVDGESQHDPDMNDGDITSSVLMIIFRAANKEAGLVILADDEAEEFRASQPISVADAVPTESDLPSAPVVLDQSDAPAEPRREWKGYH
jgi:hypothetical protein